MTTKEVLSVVNKPEEYKPLLGKKSVLAALRNAREAIQNEKTTREKIEKELQKRKEEDEWEDEDTYSKTSGGKSTRGRADGDIEEELHRRTMEKLKNESREAKEAKEREMARRKEEVEELERRIAAFEAAAGAFIVLLTFAAPLSGECIMF